MMTFAERRDAARMTATERLRQLLDERGVEWRADVTDIDNVTEWDAGPAHAVFYESKTTNPDMMEVRYFWPTPEQAVEATLGRGTCKVVSKPCDMWECECGKARWHGGAPNFCPSYEPREDES